MKKILLMATAVVLLSGAAFAQKGTPVKEKDVKITYVKDFQRQVKECTNVEWWQLDSLTYKVTYLDNERSRQAMLFSNKGSEVHYIIEKQYYPAAIRDTASHLFPKYTIDEVWVRKLRGKMSYQSALVRKSGFLWWKKVKDFKTLNFEVDGRYIGAE
jgi:hypothetical protein